MNLYGLVLMGCVLNFCGLILFRYFCGIIFWKVSIVSRVGDGVFVLIISLLLFFVLTFAMSFFSCER